MCMHRLHEYRAVNLVCKGNVNEYAFINVAFVVSRDKHSAFVAVNSQLGRSFNRHRVGVSCNPDNEYHTVRNESVNRLESESSIEPETGRRNETRVE